MTAPLPHPFSVRAKLLAIRYAWQGIDYMLRTQVNAWIQIAIALVVTAAGVAFGLTPLEWVACVLGMAAVWAAEALNTAIEAVVDLASPGRHPLAGRAKDVAAGAVLVTVGAAGLVALLVFGPHLWRLTLRLTAAG
jgi:diacylglycerol kinase